MSNSSRAGAALSPNRKQDLLQLRDKLVKATGPDAALMYEFSEAISEWRNLGGGWREHKATGLRQRYHFGGYPDWMKSIDAALALIPEGAEYQISTLYGIADFECPLNGGDDDLPITVRRRDGSVPLAICEWRIEYELARAA
jgi:hypothetical protein